jgi:hypothetical protein
MFTLRPLYLKRKKAPVSTVWDDEMFVQNFRREKRCRWENNIKTGLKRMGREDVDWTYLAKDSVKVWFFLTQ